MGYELWAMGLKPKTQRLRRKYMEETHDIKKELKKYIAIFIALLVFTVITVAVSYLHIAVAGAIIIALIIASIKVSMVAGGFMHLITEKKLIHYLLIMTFIFFLVMILITFASHFGLPEGARYLHSPEVVPAHHLEGSATIHGADEGAHH